MLVSSAYKSYYQLFPGSKIKKNGRKLVKRVD